ncbi:MAG: (2Fe-2S)-binding protein [Candidatus Tectomicrobia bacterium]|nr:(2Fe-2S)-binding protein [Candidatus Tectomicrobia bacterium]
MITITLNVNGATHKVNVRPGESLLSALRLGLGLTGAKEGCGEGDCGACTVIIDGRTVDSCIYPAGEAQGKKVRTVEGLASNGKLSPLQEAFVEHGAVQCGFCIPGMLMSATALLERNPKPSEAAIRLGLSGNLCRCTGYAKIVEAVRAAASPA